MWQRVPCNAVARRRALAAPFRLVQFGRCVGLPPRFAPRVVACRHGGHAAPRLLLLLLLLLAGPLSCRRCNHVPCMRKRPSLPERLAVLRAAVPLKCVQRIADGDALCDGRGIVGIDRECRVILHASEKSSNSG